MDENMRSLRIDCVEIQEKNGEFEIWLNEALILRGNNINELIADAKRMYPNVHFEIRKIKMTDQ